MGKITIKAKNLYKIVEENYITKVGGTLTKRAEEINIYTTEGDINMYSNTSIDMKAEKEIILGDYQEPPENNLTTHPDIEKVEFIDAENGSVLNQSAINGVENGNATPFLYGKKTKIRVILKEEPKEKLKIELTLKGKSKNTNQKFVGIDKLQWSSNIENKVLETDPFIVPLDWYNEDFEKYSYSTHKTIIDTNDLNSFSLEIFYNSRIAFLPKKENWLKPVAYRRNYEELIGLFKIDNSGGKDLSNNYENKFISINSEILNLVKEFSEFIEENDLTTEKIKDRVKTDAKKLWKLAVKQVSSGNLDDRPLYWARNKMQVRLKRHPLFEDEVDFETSIVCKDTELESIINLFEELSRNYTGIDFSKAPNGAKKVLITGFDPFVLNQLKYSWADINTQNPSGISALYFHGQIIGNNINQIDMIMTSSRNDSNFDIERFASKHRGGFFDNMNIGNSMIYLGNNEWDKNRFTQIPNGREFYETSLPIDKIMSKDLSLHKNIIFYDQSIIDDKGFKIKHPTKGGPKNNKDSYPTSNVTGKSISDSGSGGDYLSNEIMYRSTRKRDDLGFSDTKAIGHIHIADNITFSKAIEIITKIIENATN